jgi:large subunit ribosomal protein L3
MNRFQYASVEQSGPSKWVPMAAVAVAVSLGVVVGLVLSTPSADATNLHAAVATTASTMRANTYASVPRQMSQYPRQAAVGASNVYDTEEVQYTAPAFVTEAQPAMSVAGWAGLMMVPVMALAGFMFGRRNTEFQVVDPVAEEQEFAMAATTGLLGNKVGMTRIPDANGSLTPVTVIRLGPCVVTQVKTTETDGYEAVQLGYQQVKEDRLNKPESGHLAKSGAPPLKYLREYRVPVASEFTAGQVLTSDIFAEGELVDVQGNSIGKGFQGNIKRHGFKRGLMTHGSKSHREPGGTGPGTTPGRVYPGSKGPGRMGGKTTTVPKLKVMAVDPVQNLIMVKGSIPGAPGNLVSVKSTKEW